MKKILFIFMLFISISTFAQEKIDTTKVEITETERIIDKYSDKIGKFITATAESLKVPAEHVYTVLVKQSYVDSITYLIILLTGVLLLLFGGKDFFNSKNFINGDPTLKAIKGIVFFTFGFLTILAMMLKFKIIVQGFINPEYVAIEKILEILK